MREATEKRMSRRTYTKEDLTGTEVGNVKRLISEVNAESGLTIEYIEDASEAFSSIGKTYGMFKNVRTVLLMKGRADDRDLREKVGFYGERIVLDLVDMGLGTCWVAGTFDKSTFTQGESEQMVCVITVGHIEAPTFKDRLILSRLHDRRKPMNERISYEGELPEDIESGIRSVILAPSAVNSQKPHFEYKNGELTVSVPDEHSVDLVDLGIAKYHFVSEAGGSFPFGNGAKWEK